MAKFCTKCGRKLEEGEVCTCQQENNNYSEPQKVAANEVESQTTEPQPERWDGGQQTANQTQNETVSQTSEKTKEAEWISQKSTIVVNETKNVFAKIIPLLKHPVTETKKIADGKSSIPGIEFIAIKAAVVLIFTIIMLAKMDSALGGFVEIPTVTIIIMAILLTLGADCLEALMLKVFSGVLNGVTEQSAMFSVVGTRALYETLIYIVAGIVCFISANFGIIIIALTSILLPIVEFGSYRVLVQTSEDRKVYAYFIAKVIMAVISYIVIYLCGKEVLSSILGTLMGGLLNF
ncbi:hypothetical protein HMPREF9477_01922 [Lachnospiraceae bacterium 2_1_46FAA]|nr:hypothetical protein HMPREF9477_01922 [Lachnospiraceae bacterium 2_1_46FAA]